MDREEMSAGSRARDEFLVTAICLITFVWPSLVGGASARGQGWGVDQTIGLVLLFGCTLAGLAWIRRARIERAVVAPIVVAALAALLSFGWMAASAWIAVPTRWLWVSSMVTAASPLALPLFAAKHQAEAAVVASGLAAFFLSFAGVLPFAV